MFRRQTLDCNKWDLVAKRQSALGQKPTATAHADSRRLIGFTRMQESQRQDQVQPRYR
jgi:hypothetical protein